MTIEERAEEYANENYLNCYQYSGLIQAYIAGATEQKAIDDAETAKVIEAIKLNTEQIERNTEIFKYIIEEAKAATIEKAKNALCGLCQLQLYCPYSPPSKCGIQKRFDEIIAIDAHK